MFNPLDWLQLSPKDDTPAALKAWCSRHALLVGVTVLTVTLFILPAMLWSLPRIGSLAWSNEIDTKIERAISPLRNDIEQIKRKDIQEVKDEVRKSLQVANDIKASLLGGQILNSRRQQCDAIANGAPSRFWADRVLEQKAEYRKLTGEQFEMPATCAEI